MVPSTNSRFFRALVGSVAMLLPLGRGLQADDLVRLDGGITPRVRVEEATHEAVSYKAPRVTRLQRVNAAEVVEIIYTDAKALDAGRTFLQQGNWAEAAASFDRAMRGVVRFQEAGAFGKAEAAFWRFDETGAGGDEAVAALNTYLEAYKPKKGFHVPRALYLLGKAALASGDTAAAAVRFNELAGFPGDSRKLLAELGKAEVALAKKQARDAATTIGVVLNRAKSNNMTTLYRQAAALRGKALVADNRHQAAIDFLENLVKQPVGKQAVFDRYGAQAYNALGDAYVAKGGTDNEWEGLYRYLWTTVLFSNWRAESAEALYKASKLATKLRQTEDASRLLGILKGSFGTTIWAAKAK